MQPENRGIQQNRRSVGHDVRHGATPSHPALADLAKAGFLSGCYDREEDTHSVAKGSKIWYDTKANKKTEREKEKLEEFNKQVEQKMDHPKEKGEHL